MSNKVKKVKNNNEVVGPWKMAWWRFKKNKLVVAGSIVLLIIILAVVFAPFLTPYGPDDKVIKDRKQPPNARHLLGTDDIGRDYLTRVLYGGRVSLMVGLVAVSISLVIGVVIGGIAGYFGGWVDSLLMRIAEIIYSFPFIPLVITLSAVLLGVVDPNHKIYLVMVLIGILTWPGLARVIRGQILSLREQEFMEAANALGISTWSQIIKHLIPNTIGYIIIYSMLGMASAILTEAGLSFLGLGVQPPTPSWGNMVQYARKATYLKNMPWLWIPPGAMIFFTVMSINIMGEGLRNAFDPKSH